MTGATVVVTVIAHTAPTNAPVSPNALGTLVDFIAAIA